MLITYFGYEPDFLTAAFYNSLTGSVEPDILSTSTTRIEIQNPSNGMRVIFTGTNLPLDPNSELHGTLTGMTILDGSGNTVATATGFSWSFEAFIEAMVAAVETDDYTQLNVLTSLQAITFDASNAVEAASIGFPGTTAGVTLLGSGYYDTLEGSDGNDSIRPAASTDGDFVLGTAGNDTIDFSDYSGYAWVDLSYENLPEGVTFAVDGTAGTGTVTKGTSGTDTLVNVGRALQSDGIGLIGTEFDDTFTVDGGASSWAALVAGAGNDSYNLTLSDVLRISFRWGPGTQTGDGVVIDLRSGAVSNDGFGGYDQINITHNGGVLEIEGTVYDDLITGSTADERFILAAGNDVLDAGDGIDRLRYDRRQVSEGVEANLNLGTVTGTWDGAAFTHFVTGVEQVMGSRTGDDTLTGSDGADSLYGLGGDDEIYGGDGNDYLQGGDGNDFIDPGDSHDVDVVDAGAGDNIIDASSMIYGFLHIEHYDLRTISTNHIEIDGVANAGSIDTAGVFGLTQIEDVNAAMTADGLGINASDLDDTFILTVADGGFLMVSGGDGADSYTLGTSTGLLRLDYADSNGYEAATQALNLNLQTGVVANDGFGNTDTITGVGNTTLEIRATNNADTLVGSAYDDRFILRGGNDTADGGGGSDLLRYDRGTWITTGIDVDLGAGTITGGWDGTAFTHTVSNFERVRGSDLSDSMTGTLSAEEFDGGAGDDFLYGESLAAANALVQANQVYRLYQATLDRAPDAGGHQSWTEILYQGDRTLEQVANGFVASAEFQATYSGLSNSEFVELLYQNVLGRAADAGGLTTWTGKLDGGSSRASVVTGFSESTEFKNSTAAEATAFALARDPANWTDDIYRMYQATLARNPDKGGFLDWTTRLGGTATLESAATGFVKSAEFQATYGSLTNSEFVELLYQNVLGRAADANGLSNWVGKLDGGSSRASVVLGFSQSGEFVNNTTESLRSWMVGLGDDDTLIASGGDDILAGGRMRDIFVFDPVSGSDHTVLDFEAWDLLDFQSFAYGTKADLLGKMSQSGSDVVFSDGGVTVTLLDTQLGSIDVDMVLV